MHLLAQSVFYYVLLHITIRAAAATDSDSSWNGTYYMCVDCLSNEELSVGKQGIPCNYNILNSEPDFNFITTSGVFLEGCNGLTIGLALKTPIISKPLNMRTRHLVQHLCRDCFYSRVDVTDSKCDIGRFTVSNRTIGAKDITFTDCVQLLGTKPMAKSASRIPSKLNQRQARVLTANWCQNCAGRAGGQNCSDLQDLMSDYIRIAATEITQADCETVLAGGRVDTEAGEATDQATQLVTLDSSSQEQGNEHVSPEINEPLETTESIILDSIDPEVSDATTTTVNMLLSPEINETVGNSTTGTPPFKPREEDDKVPLILDIILIVGVVILVVSATICCYLEPGLCMRCCFCLQITRCCGVLELVSCSVSPFDMRDLATLSHWQIADCFSLIILPTRRLFRL